MSLWNWTYLVFSSQLWTKLWCWKSAQLTAICPDGRLRTPPGQRSAWKSAARRRLLKRTSFFFILGLQPPRFRVSLCRRSRVFHFDSSKSSASHRRNGGAQNLRRGHKKPLGAALWMIWHTRCGYSSVDAVMSADYCRFEGCGILKRAFQCGTKPRSNCKTLSIFCAGVRVKVCSKQRSENFFFFAFFF